MFFISTAVLKCCHTRKIIMCIILIQITKLPIFIYFQCDIATPIKNSSLSMKMLVIGHYLHTGSLAKRSVIQFEWNS